MAVTLGAILATTIQARDLTFDQAIDRAVNNTSRGSMIEGNLEVAQQYYDARRINMYLPEISINGQLPAYSIDESYRPFRNSFDKRLFEQRNLDFNSFIELKQSLFTGGSLVATANLVSQDNRYPDTRFDPSQSIFVDENSRQGFFRFELEQPLFRPSSVRNELNNRKDDLVIARMTRIEETTALKREVSEAYLQLLQLDLKADIAADKLEKAALKQEIDSMKLADGVISEEDYLLSNSEKLDAELESFSVQTERESQQRELATLLDLDTEEPLVLSEPVVSDHIDESTRHRLVEAWDETAPIRKADYQFRKAERQANYAASGHALTGDLRATYSLGRQKIETDKQLDEFGEGGPREENINTSGWSVALEFRLPLWDGGAGGAAVKAARYEAERARYDLTRARRVARAEISNLLNELNVSYQRLDIIRKQIDLANERLKIARDREADGQISRLTFLESRIFYLETRDKYLTELKDYLVNRIELEGKFAG